MICKRSGYLGYRWISSIFHGILPMSMSFWRMEIQRKTTRNGRNRNVFLNSPSISGGMYFPHKSREADKQSPSQPNPMFKGQQFHDFMAIIWWARYLANWSVNFPFSWTGASIHQLPIWVKDDINVDSIWFHEPFVDDFPGEKPLWSPGDQSLVMFLQDLFEAT